MGATVAINSCLAKYGEIMLSFRKDMGAVSPLAAALVMFNLNRRFVSKTKKLDRLPSSRSQVPAS